MAQGGFHQPGPCVTRAALAEPFVPPRALVKIHVSRNAINTVLQQSVFQKIRRFFTAHFVLDAHIAELYLVLPAPEGFQPLVAVIHLFSRRWRTG